MEGMATARTDEAADWARELDGLVELPLDHACGTPSRLHCRGTLAPGYGNHRLRTRPHPRPRPGTPGGSLVRVLRHRSGALSPDVGLAPWRHPRLYAGQIARDVTDGMEVMGFQI